MLRTASLSTKLIRIGTALLVVAIASIGLTLWVTRQLEGGAAAVNEAGRMRMQTWRIASAVQADVGREEIRGFVSQFDASLALLRSGDSVRPLFVPWDTQVHARFSVVEALWEKHRQTLLDEAAPQSPASIQAAGDFVEPSTAWCWPSSSSCRG